MAISKRPYVCPSAFAGSLDNGLRRLIHKPWRILEPYIRGGMTVLDLGCGPGFFTSELAILVGEQGKVIAADIQQHMLDKMKKKLNGTVLEDRVKVHLCQDERIGISERVDFVFAFWMVHEVIDQSGMFEELKYALKPGGTLWVIEPIIHVTGKSFNKMINLAESAGFEIIGRPKVALSRSVILSMRFNNG